MRVERFEDLEVWKDTRQLVNKVYAVTRDRRFAADRDLAGQMRRSSVSTMSNSAEGLERGSNADFIRFLYIAKGSAGELRSQLYVALDQEFTTQDQFNSTTELAVSVSQQLGGLIKYLKESARNNRTGKAGRTR